MADTLSTLEKIRIKVRRVTRSPSSSKITDDQIDDYVNNFVLYDFPQTIKTDYLLTTFSFYTSPNIDRYPANAIVGDPLNNMNNIYTAIYPPIYIDGNRANFYQLAESFYNANPKVLTTNSIGTGDGATVLFAGTLDDVPILRNEVLFSSIDLNDARLSIYDDGDGNLAGDITGAGTIDYLTGVYTFSFSSAPKNTEDVEARTYPYVAGTPTEMLYFNGEFRLRPVPDKPYKVEVTADKRPTALIADSSIPEFAQWWQYIALGASKKIFEDRMEMESVNLITPELENQEALILRRTSNQRSTLRTPSIYMNQVE